MEFDPPPKIICNSLVHKVNFHLFIYKLKVVMCIVKSDACGPETQEINFLGAFKAVKKKKKPTAVE